VIVCAPTLTPLKLPLAWNKPVSNWNVYGPVPPLPLALTPPVPPKHNAAIPLALAATAAGWLITTAAVSAHPLASRTVTVCAPTPTPLKLPLAWIAPVSNWNVYGPTPPLPLALIVPVPPKHNGLVPLALATNTTGSVTVTLVVAVHPVASVTVTS
jgi:hypothetical protein